MAVNLLSQAMNTINNADLRSKRNCIVPYSKLIMEVARVLKEEGYIRDYQYIDDGKGGKIKVLLAGKINYARTINPRFPVKADEWHKVEAQYLPAVGVGMIIVSTPQGVMTNYEARKRRIGGVLLAYVY